MEGAGDDDYGILQYFKKGAAIEIKSDDDGFRGSWYEGTVLRAPKDLSSLVLVKYKTLTADEDGNRPLRELLNLVQLRPLPPRENRPAFELNDEVDAYYNDGWWEGKITQTFEGEDKYLVYFPPWKEQLPFTASQLRLHRDWVKENWVPPFENKTPSPSKAEANKAVIEHNFNNGDLVEASSDDDGFQGAWFPAVFERKEADKYLIDCPLLASNDESGLFGEEVDGLHLRPRPPDVGDPGRLGYSLRVDALYNGGWWEGEITKTLEEADEYEVFFERTGEHLSFPPSKLRPHREWVNETWVPPLDPSTSSYYANRLSPEAEAVTEHNYNPGDHVEARTDEDGFYGAWFPATVLGKTWADNYMIEYEKLMNDDGTSLLREETDGLHLRPSPPYVRVTGRFQVNQKVDALYNDGWWVGTVTKVDRRGRYSVYFEPPEESKFHHSQLRVHQEWINGEWHIAAKDPKSS